MLYLTCSSYELNKDLGKISRNEPLTASYKFQKAPWFSSPRLNKSARPANSFQVFKISLRKLPPSTNTPYNSSANSLHNAFASSYATNIFYAVFIQPVVTASFTAPITSLKASCDALRAFIPNLSILFHIFQLLQMRLNQFLVLYYKYLRQ